MREPCQCDLCCKRRKADPSYVGGAGESYKQVPPSSPATMTAAEVLRMVSESKEKSKS